MSEDAKSELALDHAPPRVINDVAAVAAPAGANEFVAYRIGVQHPFRLRQASSSRAWMDQTPERFANRCLPLLVANQAGWWIENLVPFRACWTGGASIDSVKVVTQHGEAPPCESHFGAGVLTFSLPWLFRTPLGWSLWVRGPTNFAKDGIAALDGIVETDWAVATFTMNWRFTAKNHWVEFLAGDPICQLVPWHRGEIELFDPVERCIGDSNALFQAFSEWSEGRAKFNSELQTPNSSARQKRWERHYFQGTSHGNVSAVAHQVKLNLRPFKSYNTGLTERLPP